ncbi:MAG: hypothetical protein ACTHOO_00980 [Alcanivorax sp.]
MLNKTTFLSFLLSLFSFDAHAAEDLDLPPANEIREVCEYIAGLPEKADFTISGSQSAILHFDANNDGKLEKVSQTIAGTAMVTLLWFRDFDGNKIPINQKNFEWKDFGSYSYGWVPHKHNYLVGFDSAPLYLSYINDRNEEYWLCSFKAKPEVKFFPTINKKEDPAYYKKLCEDVDKGNVEFLPLEEEKHQAEDAYNIKVFGHINVDYDNDGVTENISAVDISNGAGRGCSQKFFANLDGERIVKDILRNEMQIWTCGGNEAEWFQYDGKTYLLNKYKKEYLQKGRNEIYRVDIIQDGKAKRVCDSMFNWTYEVDQYSKVVK